MNIQSYYKLLRHPEWFERRRTILTLDGNKCCNCESNKFLQVHHLYYQFPRVPWDYPNRALITLCKKCHEKLHSEPDLCLTKDCAMKPSYFPYYNRSGKTVKLRSKKDFKYKGAAPRKSRKVTLKDTRRKRSKVTLTMDHYNLI